MSQYIKLFLQRPYDWGTDLFLIDTDGFDFKICSRFLKQ
jgi:hypothetical protein